MFGITFAEHRTDKHMSAIYYTMNILELSSLIVLKYQFIYVYFYVYYVLIVVDNSYLKV